MEGAFHHIAFAFKVIENPIRPRRSIEGARAALRLARGLALTTPYDGLIENLALALVAYDQHYDGEGDHVRFFTDAALRRLPEGSGFVVNRISHYGRKPLLWERVSLWAVKR